MFTYATLTYPCSYLFSTYSLSFSFVMSGDRFLTSRPKCPGETSIQSLSTDIYTSARLMNIEWQSMISIPRMLKIMSKNGIAHDKIFVLLKIVPIENLDTNLLIMSLKFYQLLRHIKIIKMQGQETKIVKNTNPHIMCFLNTQNIAYPTPKCFEKSKGEQHNGYFALS